MRASALVLCLVAATAEAQELDHKYELGARVRGIFLTPTMIGAVAQTSSSMNSLAIGGEFVVRHRTWDVVTSLDFSFVDISDGNFLGNDHSQPGGVRDPSQDTHYIQFGNFGQLTFISTDVSIIGHTALGKWVELRYGAGVGLGGFVGVIKMTNNGRQCTLSNYRDGSQCYPHAPNVGVDIPLGRPDTEAKLKATEKSGAIDLADDPHRHVSPDVPPVVPVLNVILGLRFRLAKHVALDVEGGFRNMMFLGAGLRALF